MSHHNSRQLDLECLRLASDCMQLADDVLSPELRAHLIEMARQWTAIAEGRSSYGHTAH